MATKSTYFCGSCGSTAISLAEGLEAVCNDCGVIGPACSTDDADWQDFDDNFVDEDESRYEPTEYDEWQDYMGGDDWDHGQFDEIW